jgi:mannose-6-phosphate isomerase-like protein (cupin superfamily)
MTNSSVYKDAIFLLPDDSRKYKMGKIEAIFKADEEEANEKYCISEWWLDSFTEGPGAHSHEINDDIFYVLEGTASILIGDEWVDAPKGSFILIKKKTPHNFANRTNIRLGLLNFFIPGGFERHMPDVVKWFDENPNR